MNSNEKFIKKFGKYFMKFKMRGSIKKYKLKDPVEKIRQRILKRRRRKNS